MIIFCVHIIIQAMNDSWSIRIEMPQYNLLPSESKQTLEARCSNSSFGTPPSTPPSTTHDNLTARLLLMATRLVIAYMCCGELLPLVVRQHTIAASWDAQQVVLLSALCVLVCALSMVPQSEVQGGTSFTRTPRFLFLLNACPLTVAAVMTLWFPQSDNCPTRLYGPCNALAILVDTLGLVSARLARLNLGITLYLSSRGISSWVLGASASQLGVAESIPLHRIAGWWCLFQSVLHSVSYVFFYLETGGTTSLWLNCLPMTDTDANLVRANLTRVDYPLNRLGLVNMFGVVAFLASVILMIFAFPCVRTRCYHVFQRTHLPISILFVLCCALHDLPILLFAVPGLTPGLISFLTERCGRRRKRFLAKARILPGTSDWIELVVGFDEFQTFARCPFRDVAPRGQWISMCVATLGPESHPLSLTIRKANLSSLSSPGMRKNEMVAIVSSRAGDWSRRLHALVQDHNSTDLHVQVEGPFLCGGGAWSLDTSLKGQDEPALLLLAGGTGVTGWLPGLMRLAGQRRQCHLVWCVKTPEHYTALPLPYARGGLRISIFVTYGENCSTCEEEAFADQIRSRCPPCVHASQAAHMLAKLPLANKGVHCETQDPFASLDLPPQEVQEIGASDNFLRRQRHEKQTHKMVSLGTVLVGLMSIVVGYKNLWLYTVFKPTTLLNYTLVRRVLPIVWVIVAMALAFAIGNCVYICVKRQLRHDAGISFTEATTCLDNENGSSNQSTTSGQKGPKQQVERYWQRPPDSMESDHKNMFHVVKAGRPDFNALLLNEAAKLDNGQRLVVAACGPLGMVRAAKRAFISAKKEMRGRVCLEFSGAESTW